MWMSRDGRRDARRLRRQREFVVPMLGSDCESKLEPRALTSSPYYLRLGGTLASLSQAQNSANSTLSPLATLGIVGTTGSSSAPETAGSASPPVIRAGGPEDEVSALYFRDVNGVGLISRAGETFPDTLATWSSSSPETSNSGTITTYDFDGTTFIRGMPTPWTITATNTDTVNSQIIDGGYGTGTGSTDIEIVVDHSSNDLVQAPPAAMGGTLNAGVPAFLGTTSGAQTTAGGALTWAIAGDSPAGQQRYLVDVFQDTYSPPTSPGPGSSGAVAAVNIMSSEGVINFNAVAGPGVVVLTPGPGVSSTNSTGPVKGGYSTTVTLVLPFTSANLVTEATETVVFNSALNIATAPLSAVPTGTSSDLSSNDWTYTSSVSLTNPL
jgi:hypothetical protein